MDNLQLTKEEYEIITGGKWLSANCMSAANQLLKKEFPFQQGLNDTSLLADRMEWSSKPEDFVQIIHIPSGDWACVSNKFCLPNEVDLFDSLHKIPSSTGSIARQSCAILKLDTSSFIINIINVQFQETFDDCGLFSIAMAFDLCNSVDPYSRNYDQGKMRQHLKDGFKKLCFSPFPQERKCAVRRNRVIKQVKVDVHCVCRQPECVPMVCCDSCNTWYHSSCVSVSDEVFEKSDCPWSCEFCKLATQLGTAMYVGFWECFIILQNDVVAGMLASQKAVSNLKTSCAVELASSGSGADLTDGSPKNETKKSQQVVKMCI